MKGVPTFSNWVSKLKERFIGDSITLSGYIKTDGVTDGYAGLWIRVDPNVGFANMNNKRAKGIIDWTKYSITVPLNSGKY